MDASIYSDESELTKYVWNHYQRYFTRLEQLGAQAIMTEDKATHAASPTMAEMLRKKWGAQNNPEIIAALGEGADVFRLRVRERVMRQCADKILINRCPACNRIVRTPRAKQCLWCSHSWHDS